MPTVREFEQAFQEDPSHQPAFLALRKAYREKQRFDKLVTLYESRAQASTEENEAAELYSLAAELRLEQLADPQGAETVLKYALERSRSHIKAAERLKLLYRDQGRTSDYLTMLEMAAAAVVETGDAPRRATLEAEMQQLFTRDIEPLERSVQGPEQGQSISPDALKTVVSARKIHRALGDWPQVLRLYDLEVAATADAKRKVDLLVACAKLLADKAEDLSTAAVRVGEALRLRPDDERALELQASIFARPEWSAPDGKPRAAAVFHQLARRRNEAGDLDGALALLRRGLSALPGDQESSKELEKILRDAGRLQELDRYFRERVTEAPNKDQKIEWLRRRAKLAQEDLKDEGEALRIFEELAVLEPAGGAAAQHLGTLYTGRQNYAKLAELRERQLAVLPDPTSRLPLLRELASLYRDRLGDADQAAVYLHAILQLEPGDEAALRAYGDHFRRRGDFNALADLLEYAADGAINAGNADAKVAAWLQEVAAVSERNLNDTARALSAWRKLEELGIDVEQSRETQKRLLLKDKRWDGMAEVLTREADTAPDNARRVEVWRRLARLYLDKLNASEKAVETFHRILSVEPADAAAFRALIEIYENEKRWDALAETLRAQLAHVTAPERIALLRRLGALYSAPLERPQDAAWAARQLLEQVPGDREAFVRLEETLEASGDLPALAQVLIDHAGYLLEHDKAALLARAASIYHKDLEQPDVAAGLWEKVLELVPGYPGALEALVVLYDELNRPSDLARLLDLQVERAADEPQVRVVALRRLAGLAGGPLADPARGLAAWEALLRHEPDDAEALEQVSGIYRSQGNFQKLADALGRRVNVLAGAELAVPLALERAHVLEVRLHQPLAAIEVLEQLVDGVDPRNVEAFERLRRLAEAQDDWQKVANVAERQMRLQDDPADRIRTAMEIAIIHRDRLGDPDRAVTAFELVLGLAPDHRPALEALAALYTLSGDSQRLIATNEKLLDLTEGASDRRRLMFDIAEACESGLAAPRQAFEWVARAHAESPDDDSWQRLEALSEAHDLWEDLIRVHEAARARATTADEQVSVAQKIADIYEQRLDDAARAFAVLREALGAQPDGHTLLEQLERLAAVVGDWQGLLDVYMRVARGRPALEARADLLQRRAQVFEERLQNPSSAMDEWLRRFGLDHTDAVAKEQILRLAGRTGRWEDALKVYGQLFARAVEPGDKVHLAKQAAALVEERVQDRLRAFRAYLNAFRLDPQDAETLGHLWRLASTIGRFGDRTKPDRIVPELPVQPIGTSGANPDATIHLMLGDLAPGAFADVVIEDVTDTLTLDDAEEVDGAAVRKGAPPLPVAKAPPPRPRPPSQPGSTAIFDSPWAEFANAYALLPAVDTATRRRNLLKIAAIWEKGAQQPEQAFESLEKAFRLDPFDAEVRSELQRLSEERGAWDRLCDIYLSVVGGLPSEEAIAIHHEVAAIRERLGQRDKAEERYIAIVNLRTHDRKALDQLEDIYRNSNRFADLAGLLERRGTELELGTTLLRAKAVELASLYDRHLDRPYEAIDTLEGYLSKYDDEPGGPDAPERLAELRQVLDDLTRLYGRVDLWAKAAGATQRSLDLESQPNERRRLALSLAQIYEQELSSPAKAAEAFGALLQEHPEDEQALAALDRLYEALGRFEELSQILAQRIALAPAADKLALVKRRSRVLEERLANPDAAAANLRGLGPQMLEDDEIAGSLLRNLRRAGLSHEAVRLLLSRIEWFSTQPSSRHRVVELQLELARLRLDDLADVDGAREALQAARTLAPERADTLNMLARLHLKEGDFAAFAQARTDEAAALGNDPQAAVAFLEAGRVQRDQLGNPQGARKMFEQALRVSPAHAEASRALASVLTELGELAQAEQTLRALASQSSDPKVRAEALTDLARTVAQTEGHVEAMALLEQAVELAPDHQPALVAMANLHYQEQQWEQAERRYMQALRRMKNSEAAEPLLQRLAEVYEKLGRPEDGYRQLQEADKQEQGRLAVKLAMGRNRFHARKWREALAHLENLDAHPQASAHAGEVGAGLALAGESALKLKQPDKARELFARALAQAPQEARALKALAMLEMGAGALDTANTLLQRLPLNEVPALERAALLEQLGDLYQERDNGDAARAAYQEAVSLIKAPTQAQLPLFDKTLALQKAAGAVAEAAETSARLIGLEADPKQRAKRRREAAATLVQHKQFGRAAELLSDCLDDDGGDEAALIALLDVHDELGTPEACVFRLERILPQLPPPAGKPKARARRVALWHRLGQLSTSSRGDARRAFERALDLDPEHQPSRERLTELYKGPDDVAAGFANHRALALLNPARAESVRLLAQSYLREGKPDAARCAFEVLDVLGLAEETDRTLLLAHPRRAKKADEPYQSVLTEASRRAHLVHPDAAKLAEVFATMWEGGLELDGPTLDQLGVTAEDKISPLSEQDVAKVFAEVSKALDNQRSSLYIAWDPRVQQMQIALSRPPAVVMPSALATEGALPAMRFWLGRTLELTRPEHVLAATIAPRAFSHLFGGVLKAFHPRHARRRGHDSATDAAARLKKALPYRVAKRLGELFGQMQDEPFSSAHWRHVVEQVGNRAGLLACDDLNTAARCVLGRELGRSPAELTHEDLRMNAQAGGPLTELLRFALSESHFALRAQLGLDVGAAEAA